MLKQLVRRIVATGVAYLPGQLKVLLRR